MTQRNGPSILRTAGGEGAGALLRAERPRLDELPAPNVEDAQRGAAVLEARGRPFQRGNKAAQGRKPAACLLGLPVEGSDPRWCRALRRARRYLIRRRGELAVLNGGNLGAGPCAMLANAARALAASHVIYELAGITADPALFAQASALADRARQQELTAIAVAEREADARRDAKPHNAALALARALEDK